MKLHIKLATLLVGLSVGSQCFQAPANALLPSPSLSTAPSLIAYTDVSALPNVMFEYRKETAKLAQLNAEIKSDTAVLNSQIGLLNNLIEANKNATPAQKIEIANRIPYVLGEIKTLKDRVMIGTGAREQTLVRLKSINEERARIRESLTRDLNTLNNEANIIKTNLKALN